MLAAHNRMNDSKGMEGRVMQMTVNTNKGRWEGTQMRVGEQWQEQIQHTAAAAMAVATQQLQPQRCTLVPTTQKPAHPHHIDQN